MNATNLKNRIDALIAEAREYDRRNDATMRNQTLRSIEDLPGISRRRIAAAKREVMAAAAVAK